MYYPITVLKKSLEDMYATRALVDRLTKPTDDQSEVFKLRLHIEQMEDLIRMIEGFKKSKIDPEKYFSIYEDFQNGVTITKLAEDNSVSYKTLQRIIRKVKEHRRIERISLNIITPEKRLIKK